jgi:hypothetical protein
MFFYAQRLIVFPGFMLDNPLLTTVGSLIGVSGSILSYIMVCMTQSPLRRLKEKLVQIVVCGDEPIPDERPIWRHWITNISRSPQD